MVEGVVPVRRVSRMSSVVSTLDVVKKYGKNVAISGVSLTIEAGSVVGLIGPNGAGKTTFMRMLVDVIRPTSGSVTVLGHTPRTAPVSLRERIGYLPGELRLATRHNGRHVLEFFREVSGPVPARAIDTWAERLNCDLSKPVRSLSKGNKQKLGLIQALMHEPELVILDEPTSGLDPLIQREFVSIVKEVRDSGRTVLLSSHVLGEIQHSADRVAVLSEGRIVADGPLDTLALTKYKRVRIVVDSGDHTRVLSALEALGLSRRVAVSAAGEGLVGIDARFSGGINDLLRAISSVTIRDLTISEPDLEEAVLSLYDGEQGHPGGSHA